MKQTIEIEVPDGKKAVVKFNQMLNLNQIVFEDIKPQLPKTWEEFCKNYPCKKDECYITTDCELYSIAEGIERNINHDRNLLPSKQAVEQHLALIQLHQLRDCYRQGWKPDWKDNEHKKYIIQSSEGEYYVDDYYNINTFLAFQDEKQAKEFLTNFRELIEQAGDLI